MLLNKKEISPSLKPLFMIPLTKLSGYMPREVYAISRTDLRWLLEHCQVCSYAQLTEYYQSAAQPIVASIISSSLSNEPCRRKADVRG